MTRNLILIAIATLSFSFASFAQDTRVATHTVAISAPAVALIDLEGTKDFALAPVAPTEAGNALDFTTSTNSAIWMNVSSVVGSLTKTSRDVGVAITSGAVPSGMLLKVVSAVYAGAGEGTFGTPSAILTLSGTSQNIVSGFGTCYTQDGVSKGYNLTYSLVKNTYSAIKFDNGQTVTLTYTISD